MMVTTPRHFRRLLRLPLRPYFDPQSHEIRPSFLLFGFIVIAHCNFIKRALNIGRDDENVFV
jgi:hypothetical protein